MLDYSETPPYLSPVHHGNLHKNGVRKTQFQKMDWKSHSRKSYLFLNRPRFFHLLDCLEDLWGRRVSMGCREARYGFWRPQLIHSKERWDDITRCGLRQSSLCGSRYLSWRQKNQGVLELSHWCVSKHDLSSSRNNCWFHRRDNLSGEILGSFQVMETVLLSANNLNCV